MADDDRTTDLEADEAVASRADLLPEEKAAGSDDPEGQAEAILAESEERIATRDAPSSGNPVEHRTSEDATPPVP